ncbi:uncharacterized protein [Eucyclogobius newberryi]|uniref:uncharacterized protein n=1 Tax=Eucyclogobius newberryi TaxID=166745 RepID=UPI003B5BBDEE
MKPWYLYTSKDNEHLYDEDFDLEALLCPTPTGGVQEPEAKDIQPVSPTIQVPSNPEESRLVLRSEESLVQPCPEESALVQPQTPEESLLVRELREQLELTRTNLENQVQVNKSLDQKLKTQERLSRESGLMLKHVNTSLQKKERELQEQIKAHKEIRYLYNTAVQDKLQLKQQLANTNRLMEKMREQLSEQDMAMAELKNKLRSVPEACSRTPTTSTEAVGEVANKENQQLSRRVQHLISKLVTEEADQEAGGFGVCSQKERATKYR